MNNIQKVLQMLKEFRQSEAGCAWTQSQTFQSLVPQTIEEAYELAEAVELNDTEHLKSELGDILYHFLFYTLLGEEQQRFTLEEICASIIEKHRRRMPSIEQRKNFTAEEVNDHWESIKKLERAKHDSILDGVPNNTPALIRGDKIQRRAAEVGFDWENATQVIEKIQEEIEEVKHEISVNDQEKIQDEIGDLLFSVVNLARHLEINSETALRQANRKFEMRFRQLEKLVQERQLDLKTLDFSTSLRLWEEVKGN